MYQYQVSFSQAIQMAFDRYCCFTGRSSRSEYWWFTLFCVLANIVLSGLGYALNADWIEVISLAWFLPGLGLCVRRMHDINKSGWWVLINLIPFIGNIIFLVFCCQDSYRDFNQYGPVPNVTNV